MHSIGKIRAGVIGGAVALGIWGFNGPVASAAMLAPGGSDTKHARCIWLCRRDP